MISHQHQCFFTHVPKTGGKSVLAAFGLPTLGVHYDGSLTHIEEPFGYRQLRIERKQHLTDYFCFTIVRDPLDRLVSAFFYLDGGGCNSLDTAYRDQKLRVYKGEFLDFVEDLENHIEQDHFKPQAWWITDTEGNLLPDFIGRYENLQADFAGIARHIGLALKPLAHLNASCRPAVKILYSEHVRQKVAEIYADDYRLLGYRTTVPFDGNLKATHCFLNHG